MRIVQSVGVMSVAKIMGAIHALLGLVFVPFFLLFGLIASMAPKQNGGNTSAVAVGLVGALVLAVIAPVFYGTIGFIFGAIGAFLYNVIAKRLGGIEVEVRLKDTPALIA